MTKKCGCPYRVRPEGPADDRELRRVVPQGLLYLRRAFNLDPEVVYLVSTDITGAGAYEIDRDELFSLLDELNPADSNDRRRAIIRCIQLLEEDSLETLREIARRHGTGNDGSDNGFAFIDRKSLGLD